VAIDPASFRYELDAGSSVATLTLDRPERLNALTFEVYDELRETFDALDREPGVRAIVITGAGRAFCSGADLSVFQDEYEQNGPDLSQHLDDEFHPMVHAIGGCAVPTVAAINGVAAGAGMGLALGCDIRVMAESAYLTSAFTAIGLTPDSGSTWLLPHHVGTSVALDMALTNRRMGAEEALSRGLCVAVAPDDEVVQAAITYAEGLADMSTDALVTTRRLIFGSMTIGFAEALEAEKAQQGRLGKTDEHAEGVAAFLEKREPDFRNPA
jgi:2-(1,2-epoxy-1,2-dihydrophenyl)acetyl-CoA isomerase